MQSEIETKALEALLAEVSAGIDEYRNGRFGTWGDASRWMWMVKFTYSAEQLVVTARTYLAALDSPIGEQGVKALEWRRTETWADAECPVYGRVSVFIRDDLFDWSLNGIVNCRAKCATLDEAIAEIEEERANRIRAALSPERKEPVAWRLLQRGEKIEPTDQFLQDDAVTWRPCANEWCVGAEYSALFQPMRRRAAVPATPGQPT